MDTKISKKQYMINKKPDESMTRFVLEVRLNADYWRKMDLYRSLVGKLPKYLNKGKS